MTADLVLLGEDLNAGPETAPGKPFTTMRALMSNSIKEYYMSDVWLDAKYDTFGNIQNDFTRGLRDPENYDYIFYKSNMERVRLHVTVGIFNA